MPFRGAQTRQDNMSHFGSSYAVRIIATLFSVNEMKAEYESSTACDIGVDSDQGITLIRNSDW